MFFLQLCADLGQPLNRLQSVQGPGLLASLGKVVSHNLSYQVRDAPSFLLSDLSQGLVLFGFQQELRSI